jgi:hypothetical protein
MTQSVFTPEFAPFAVVGFLGTGFLLFVLLAATLISFFTGRRRLARWLAAAEFAGAGAYFGLLLIFSFTSREETLAKGDRKYFCEIDCHLAYSLEDVSRTKVLGVPPHLTSAVGVFHLATVKTWFDPNTIASFRGNAPLTPNPRVVYVVDESGHRYEPSAAGQNALEESRGGSAPLTRPLRPGESYTTRLVFDLPEKTERPRLFLGDPPGVERLLIGHENSFFHKRIFFELQPAIASR